MIVDLHNHAELSLNTAVGIEDYLPRARVLGVAVAVTEHNRLSRWGGTIGGVLVLPGMEVLNDYGDFLVFGAPEDCLSRRDIFSLIDYVHRLGGVVIAAHPFTGHGVCRAVGPKMAREIIARVDAVEVLNGRAPAGDCARARRLAVAHGKPEVGGSDAHRPEEMFRAATHFAGEIKTVSDLVREIKAGRCRAVRMQAGRVEGPRGGDCG